MLQISNMDDGKSEWNINETHIIIPMIDGDVTNKDPDKILTSTLTLNSLEGGDQTILTNALENSLVIGLDKNLFETHNYRSDLVIIQNSDLKLFSCNSDLKNPVAYALSYMDQDKSEILWQTPVSKDNICGSDKAILEVRDVLNYDDCVNSEVEKSQQQVNLDGIDPDIASQVTKTDSEILTEDTVTKQKKETQFITFYSSPQNSEADVILPNLDTSKFIENVQRVENKKIFENGQHSEPDLVDSAYKLGGVGDKSVLNITESVMEINEPMPVKVIEYVKHKTDKETLKNRNKDTKDEKAEEKLNIEGVSSFLPEKSLPLKKKAKMKRTVMSFASENRMSLLKHDMVANHLNIKYPAERHVKKASTKTILKDQCDNNEPLVNKVLKRKKSIKFKANPKKQQSITEPVVQEEEVKKLANNSLVEGTATKINFYNFDRNEFKSIYDLVECLRKCRMINAAAWQTLNSGLKEMKVDILKEMNAKINEEYSPQKTHYSAQLKAFALVLYFKQPAAFNHLSQVYKTGWPSLSVIKEWKRRINSNQGPNFMRAERGAENNKP